MVEHQCLLAFGYLAVLVMKYCLYQNINLYNHKCKFTGYQNATGVVVITIRLLHNLHVNKY